MSVGAGQMIGAATEAPVEPRSTCTHIEIRRVQNGFVVMAINFGANDHHLRYNEPQRASFVCNTPQELGATIESLANAAEMNWLPTVDLPLVDMVRHSGLLRAEQKIDQLLRELRGLTGSGGEANAQTMAPGTLGR